jgi:hypothetical protein
MTFWDVRPLVKDRVNAPFESRHVVPYLEPPAKAYANDHTTPGSTLVNAVASSQIGMYRAGGWIHPPIDIRAAANQASGYAPVAGKPWFLYALFPASLPRWVRYSAGPSGRVPTGPLGIMCVSDVGPVTGDGFGPTLAPPTATGLGSIGPTALITAGPIGAGPVEKGMTMQACLVLINPDAALAGPAPVVAASTDKYTLVANTHFPKGAKSVVVKVSATFTGTPAALDQVHVTANVVDSTGNRVAKAIDWNLPIIYGAGGSDNVAFQAEVPLIAFGTENSEPDDNLIFVVEWSTIATRTLQGMSIIGWRL